MSERREEYRQEADKLWDKTFEDNQDLDDSGHLSRTVHRKQNSHNSRITTVLIVLIIILAATPIIYWVHNEQSFNHPIQTEKVAKSSSHVKKASSHAKSKAKSTAKSSAKKSSTVASDQSLASSTSTTSAEASSTSSSVVTSTSNESSAEYATVSSGQGIYRVAVNNGLTVDELASLNNISPDTQLHPGQRLRVK